MEKAELKNVIIDQSREVSAADLWVRDVELAQHLGIPEVSVITGVRRCGKSSLLSLIAAEVGSTDSLFYLNFEDVRLVSFGLDDFQRALDAWLELKQTTPDRIFFFYDEIQVVDGWQRWIAQLAKNKRYKVFITGSNSKLLSGELASLLTGRHLPLTLYPFSFREIARQTFGERLLDPQIWLDSNDKLELRRLLLEYMEYGGFPRVFLSKSRQLLSQYFADIVLKDIAVRRRIRNEKPLLELGTILMADATRLINKTRLASAVGIKDAETVSSYIHFFAETYLGFEVKGYYHSKQKTMRSQSKFYGVDHALASFVGGSISPDVGVMLENMVYVELLRRGYSPCYWRSEEGFEVDFVITRGRRVTHAIQVCYSLGDQVTREREARALHAAAAEIRPEVLQIITLDPAAYPEISGIIVSGFEKWAVIPSLDQP